MLKIYFARKGKKKQPFFRIVVNKKERTPASGFSLENLGFYNPLTKERNINKERINYWLEKGAQPSNSVHNLLVKEGILKAKKIAVHKVVRKAEEKEIKGKESKAPKAEEIKNGEQVEEKKTKASLTKLGK